MPANNDLLDATLELQESGGGTWKLRVVHPTNGTPRERVQGVARSWDQLDSRHGTAVSGAAPLAIPLKLEGISAGGVMRDYGIVAELYLDRGADDADQHGRRAGDSVLRGPWWPRV